MSPQRSNTELASDTPAIDQRRRRGRGARSNSSSRFDRLKRVETIYDDVPAEPDDEATGDRAAFETRVHSDTSRSVITSNDSPDIGFDRSINPYRGCEHGCIYCYARPTHSYLGHSPGLDFETELYAKHGAAELLRRELSAKGYQPKEIALGTVTDPYQPIERKLLITRQVLEVLAETNHPVGIVTKSALVTRDIDILARLAERKLAKVALSVTTLDRRLARSMEPRASTPERRLEAIRQLSSAGIPASVMVAPIIPGLNDSEIEAILEAARRAGARSAGYVVLRLPLELKDLFREWLSSDQPHRANRVMSLVCNLHGGKDYRSDFGVRQVGSGPMAQLIAERFRLARRRLGLEVRRLELRTDLFRPPPTPGSQLQLF